MRGFSILLELWKTVLHIGEVYGFRPGPEVLNRLSTVEEREGTIPPENWWAYLWPSLRRVDDRYAACLADSLRRAVAELGDPATDLHYRLNASGSAVLTKGALGNEALARLDEIRARCEVGAFDVEIRFPILASIAALRRDP